MRGNPIPKQFYYELFFKVFSPPIICYFCFLVSKEDYKETLAGSEAKVMMMMMTIIILSTCMCVSSHVTLQCPSRFRQVLFHDGERGAAGFNPSTLLLSVREGPHGGE